MPSSLPPDIIRCFVVSCGAFSEKSSSLAYIRKKQYFCIEFAWFPDGEPTVNYNIVLMYKQSHPFE